MYEYIELSSSPVNEECAQLGADDYEERSKIECRIYRQQLERMFPIPLELDNYVWFGIKKFEHDFGWYREVIIRYDYNNDAAADFAYNLEENLPEHWGEAELEILSQASSVGTGGQLEIKSQA